MDAPIDSIERFIGLGLLQMHDINSITFRLESYLLQLSDVNQRWTEWLGRGELAVVTGDKSGLHRFESQAAGLVNELAEMIGSRNHLLEDAKMLGLPHVDLHSLARALPAWERPRIRAAVSSAQQQLANLRRLHVATWILLHQRLQVYRDSLALLMVGTTKQSVYVATPALDGGGQLLDASL